MERSCLIVGAGLAGLTAGRRLQELGWKVTLLDKGRVASGRMATRQIGGATFDHGAQFFTVRDQRFMDAVQQWIDKGIARAWFTQEGHTRYIGVRGMNSIAHHLTRGLDVRTSEHVESVASGWRVGTRTDTYEADAIILTAPMEQALAISQFALSSNLRDRLGQIRFEPCTAVMASLSKPSLIAAPGYTRPASGPIAWIADNQQKGISALPSITIHAQPEASRIYGGSPLNEVGGLLLEAARTWIDGEVLEHQVHRWKYSMPVEPLPEQCIVITEPGPLVFAGDAFGGPRIEGAYLSGLAAADALNGI